MQTLQRKLQTLPLRNWAVKNAFPTLISRRNFSNNRKAIETFEFADCFSAEKHTPEKYRIIDCRSPCEYQEDCIPGATNWPVLTDEQRVEVGTLYKQDTFEAKKLGAMYIARNISQHLQDNNHLLTKGSHFFVYCLKGGQRSSSMATVLQRIGFKVEVLAGGYKTFRNQVVQQTTEFMSKQFGLHVVIIRGSTGSGKSLLLSKIKEKGGQVLDLETAAKHYGSILGSTEEHFSLSQKKFESSLYTQLMSQGLNPSKGPLFIEGESARVGKLAVPHSIRHRMIGKWPSLSSNNDGSALDATTVVQLVQKNLDHRVQFIRQQYAHLEAVENREKLLANIKVLESKTKERYGSFKSGRWSEMVERQQFQDLVRELIELHYDPAYTSSSKQFNFKSPIVLEYDSPIDQTSVEGLADAVMCCSK